MKDINNVEIKLGDIVEIKGSCVKRDNGLYMVKHVPGQPNWSGSDVSLEKILKSGKMSKASYSVNSFPLVCYINDRQKSREIKEYNAKNATIEVRTDINNTYVLENLKEELESYKVQAERIKMYNGEGKLYNEYLEIIEFYKNTIEKAETEEIEINEVIAENAITKKEPVKTESIEKNNNTTCKVNFNQEKNGIELLFSEKPSQEIRNNIKVLGFRWSKFNKVWYAKNTEATREKLKEIGLLKEDIKTDMQEKTNNDSTVNFNKNIACNVGLKEEEVEITIDIDDINLEGLFDNIEIENNNRLSKEDQEKMNQFDEILKDLQKNGQKYIDFYRENKLYNYSSRSENNKEEVKISIWSFEENFVEKVLFKEIENLINNVIYYFKEKYNVKLEYKEHSKDYSLSSRITKAEENFKYFMNIAIDDIVNEIIEEMGGMSFNDKALDESKSAILGACRGYNRTLTDVKGINVNITDFLYYDSWGKDWGEYRNTSQEKIIHLFKLISYENTNELSNNYEFITTPLNDYNNKFIGEYEINDSILKSFKTFKNGKIQLKFNSGSQALSFAKKYLGYQE